MAGIGIKLNKFFDKGYFEIYSYEEIVRYADMLKVQLQAILQVRVTVL